MPNNHIPTNLKLLKGTAQPCRLNPDEPQYPVKAPDCPEWIDENAKEVWRQVAPWLEGLGLLSEIDQHMLAGYCISVSRLRECEEFLIKNGMTYESVSREGCIVRRKCPEVTIAQEERRLMDKYAAAFGIGAAYRYKVKATKKPPARESDPYDRPATG